MTTEDKPMPEQQITELYRQLTILQTIVEDMQAKQNGQKSAVAQ